MQKVEDAWNRRVLLALMSREIEGKPCKSESPTLRKAPLVDAYSELTTKYTLIT